LFQASQWPSERSTNSASNRAAAVQIGPCSQAGWISGSPPETPVSPASGSVTCSTGPMLLAHVAPAVQPYYFEWQTPLSRSNTSFCSTNSIGIAKTPTNWPVSSYTGSAAPIRVPSKYVYFQNSPFHSVHQSETEIQPYSEIYGIHPDNFEFDNQGKMIVAGVKFKEGTKRRIFSL